MLRACGNIAVVSKLLGHSTIAMTERYAHATQDDVLAAMEQAAESRNSPEESSGGAPKGMIKNKNPG